MTKATVTWGYSTKSFASAEDAHRFAALLRACFPRLVAVTVRVLAGA